MSDTVFTTQSVAGGDTSIDNEQIVQAGGTAAKRQRVRIGGSAGTLLAEVSSGGALFTSDITERSSGTITASSGTGAAPSTGLSDVASPPAANSTVVLTPAGDHSSWSVQVTGTWVGTLATEVSMDGVTWVPVNSRQSAGGRYANNFTQNGLFRGVFGGMLAFRVRATAWTSGTATVKISLGDDAAVFMNSDVVVQAQAQYYAASSGLNSSWTVASQEVTLANGTAEQPVLFIFNNNAAGGPVAYLHRISIGASQTARIRRYRSFSPNLTRTSGGTAITPRNRAGVAPAAGPTNILAYYGATLVLANQPTDYEKAVFVTGGGQDTDNVDGSILLPPQQGILWSAVQPANGTIISIEATFWDGSSLT